MADGIGTLSGQGFPNSFFFLLSNCSAVQSIVCHPTRLGASKNRPLARWPTGFPNWVPQWVPQETAGAPTASGVSAAGGPLQLGKYHGGDGLGQRVATGLGAVDAIHG